LERAPKHIRRLVREYTAIAHDRARRQPIAPVEIAHRSCSACLLHHIAMEAKRKLYWDPLKERFKNDDAANALSSRPQRPPYMIG